MSTLQQVVAAFRTAVHAYEINGSGRGCVAQRDLLPVSVLAADNLLAGREHEHPIRPFICAAGMLKDPDRQWVVKNLAASTHYQSNNMVDICAMRGNGDPYEILLTMESEGWSQNAVDLIRRGAAGNAALWDLYKLLQVPSPCRVFVTRSPHRHHAALLKASGDLAAAYAPSVAAGELFAVQIPTASLRRSPALFAHWPAGAWAAQPSAMPVHLV